MTTLSAKSQLIPGHLDVFLSSDTPKNQRNFLQISSVASKKWLKQKIKVLPAVKKETIFGAARNFFGPSYFLTTLT